MTANEVVDGVVNASPMLRDAAIPSAVSAGLQAAGAAILNYEAYANEFINVLVNRIAFTEAKRRAYNNPLKVFKGESIPLGNQIQELIANPAVATAYDKTAMADYLTPANPDVKAVYYRQNRQDKYKVTVYDEGLKAAFVSADAFNSFLNMIMDTMNSGDNIDEYTIMRDMIGAAIDDGTIVTASVSGSTDEALSKALLLKARTMYLNFQFPSTSYNGYAAMAEAEEIEDATPLVTWTPPERFVILVRSDVAASVSVDVLAAAFNMDKADFIGRQIIVDSFGTGATSSKTLAVAADESFMKVRDTVYKLAASEYNAATLSRTWYLHHWGIYSLSPLANAVALVKGN